MNIKSIIVILVLLGGAGLTYQHVKGAGSRDNAPKKQAVLVTTAPVVEKDMPIEVSAVGTVVPYQSVTVRARIDSQVMEVKFHAGDDVKQGDLLFQLDDRAIKAQIAEQESNLVRDQAQDKNLKTQYDRKAKLFAQGFETQENLDTARGAYEAQHATVAATAAALENLKVQLEYTRITAPISGRTGTIGVTAGNNVKANDTTPLVTLNQVKPIWAQVALPQHFMDDLRDAKAKGPVTAVAQHEGGKPVSGTLDYLDNAVDPATGTFALRALFPNEDEALWPGMFVTVTLTVGTAQKALVLPEVAIQRGAGGDFVYVAQNGKAVRRAVKTAFIQKGEAVISEGPKAGEAVITDGMMKLDDGSEIGLADDNKAATAP